jgi:hypothetical protein
VTPTPDTSEASATLPSVFQSTIVEASAFMTRWP